MSNLSKLQQKLGQSRERFLEAIENLPDEGLTQPGAVGDYAVADVMALLTAWEAELITGLMRLEQGKKPGKLLAALADRPEYEAQVMAANNGRPLDQIFDDFQQVRMQLEMWLEAFSDADLGKPKRFKWFRGKSLMQIVAETTY
ncbi:MAG: ClbS/DfsB family four-helix bundle protein [Anaerolineae bacterium]